MRVAGPIALLAAAMPALATRGTLGFALGNENPDSTCKSSADYKSDFEAIKHLTTLVRTYSASNCDTAKNIIPAAKEKGFKVVLGVWPDTDEAFNQDFDALKKSIPGNEDSVHAITVGSETLYRGDIDAQKLLTRINQVKKEFPDITVGTVDSWNKFADGTADPIVQGGVTYFLVNGFAYWQGQTIDNATATYFDDMAQAKARIEQAAGDNAKNIRFGNGETGWPTDGGSDYGAAKASTNLAKTYYKNAVCALLTWGIDVFYFEAFDETWKPESVGDNGEPKDETHWGLFTDDHLEQSVSSANSALSPPPPRSTNPSGIRGDRSHLSALLQSPFPSPAASTRSAAGSPGRPTSPGNRSVAPNQPSTLPALPKYRGDKKAESSIYYTTRLSWSLSQDGAIDRESEDSSPASINFGLEPNRPNILGNLVTPEDPEKELGGGPSAERIRVERRGKSIQEFTQDWINQYVSGQHRSERSNWLSDDSGSEAPSFITAQNHFTDDASDDWLGLESDTREQDLLKTPTLTDFVNRRAALVGRREAVKSRPKLKESLHRRADTLRQEDFWGFAYDKGPQSIIMTEAKESQPSVEAEQKMASPTEKPLPPPPGDEKGRSSTAAIPATHGEADVANQGKTTKASPLSQRAGRKKIPWRGKGCIIDLPLYDKRGTEESGYRLLTAEDVKQRLKQWEDQGYDVRGFSVSAPEDPSDIALGGASRPSFPEPGDMQEEIKPGNYTVSFPNKALWDEYVNFLQEEKLRALGVFGGEDEVQPSASPASAFNQVAPFPGLVSSPPVPTASAASNPLSMHHPFSPQLAQAANMNNGIASLASPASQFGTQSPFYGADQGMMSGFVPFQPTPPAQGSLTPQSFVNLRQSAPTSTVPGTLSSLTSMLSPVSPLDDQNPFHPGFSDYVGQSKDVFDEQVQHDAQNQFADDQLRPLRTPPPNPDNFHASTVEIAQPTPRGHSRGHNLSETLQRGIDQIAPDYHLEESIGRELDDGYDGSAQPNLDGPGVLKSRWALPETKTPQRIAQHLNHFYGESYSGDNAQEGSDIDTNPSLSGTPRRTGSLSQHIPWHDSKQSIGSYAGGHRSKLSTSSLNVEAKEFAPTSPPAPPVFPLQQNSFQFPTLEHSVFSFGGASRERSSGRLNVAAPAFTPSFAASNVNTGGNFGQDVGSREFKFSAPQAPPAPSLNVAAPEFNPGRTKIFGDFDFSEVAKSSKRSKAIPIVRPDEDREADRDAKEARDEHGRSNPTDRHKRARRRGDASEGEASYSMPHALTEANNLQAQPLDTSRVPAEGKENALPPQQDETTPLETKAALVQSEDPVARKDTPISEASTWAPLETKAGDVSATQDSADPDELQRRSPKLPLKHDTPEPEAPREEPTEAEQDKLTEEHEPAETELRSSALSAAAKPFHFKPSIAEFVPISAEKPLPPTKDTPPKANKGLMASRYAVESAPPSPPARQLSTELTASVDVEVKEDPPVAASSNLEEPQPHAEEGQDSPDEDQLNAIMEQLNDDSDVGVERLSTPHPPSRLPESVLGPSKEKRHAPADNRSEPPSPSPGRGPVSHTLNVPKLDFDAQSQFSATPSKAVVSATQSPIRQLLSRNDHISDWDDVISSGEDVKLTNRSRFFDRRINDLLGPLIDERLGPLEHALSSIQLSLATLNSNPRSTSAWRKASGDVEDSDADDEDEEYEEDASYRTKSPLYQKERKLEKLKSKLQAPQQPANTELLELRDRVAELHSVTTQKLSQDNTADLRQMMQEVVASQLNQRSRSEAEEIGADSLMLQINGLKDMLRLTDERAEEEYKKRRQAQDTIAELQRLLKTVEEDAARHSAAAESAETRLLQLQTEKLPYFESIQQRADLLEKERETTRLTLDELSSKNIALQGTLDEYRSAADEAKRENEEARDRLEEAKSENHHLRNTVASMATRIEDGLNIRKNLSEKLDHLQDQMAALTGDVTRDQASWRRKEEELNAKYNELRASHSRETKLREQLEVDIAKLEEQEREAAKLKFIFGQSQQENARLEEFVNDLRQKNHDLELKAAHFEREFNEARESSRVEIQRTRTSLETDLDAASSQVNIVRAELEAQIVRLQTQLDNVKLDADTARERYEMLLEEAQETKASAVAAAIETKDLAIEEQRKSHERVLNDLRERHARALHNSSEDRQRIESHHLERLAFSEEKAQHLQERVAHLEEKLEITQSAARAAAEAAQSAKAAGPISASHTSSPSMSFSKGSSVPEKISPQALRESILVLQDQLQQRETRIDELEHELSNVDKEAPSKLKEKDTEINWLRELLDVRVNELQDIVNTLSQPSFNQGAVRDAAIRLKTNLQMQQQEKERAMNGQTFPSFPSLSNLTASPRALPLAAAAAWGNWRKGRDSSNSNASEQTPSKSSPAGNLLSGLLTPPSSDARHTSPSGSAPPAPGWGRPSGSRPLKSYNTTNPRPLSSRAGKIPEPPTTPPLLRRSSYDHDAEPTDYSQPSFEEEDESTTDGLVSASPKEIADGPFGPQIS
ncbi:putative myosin class II heavy chain (MHC) [Aspergillus lucknowensis]|uniref:Glucan endo-1,3-beta-glucosidase eglC n=1 Tax=Aspergillus lucknowensis TaxID=176173 RepID=A0ABR4M5W2_9EURO